MYPLPMIKSTLRPSKICTQTACLCTRPISAPQSGRGILNVKIILDSPTIKQLHPGIALSESASTVTNSSRKYPEHDWMKDSHGQSAEAVGEDKLRMHKRKC